MGIILIMVVANWLTFYAHHIIRIVVSVIVVFLGMFFRKVVVSFRHWVLILSVRIIRIVFVLLVEMDLLWLAICVWKLIPIAKILIMCRMCAEVVGEDSGRRDLIVSIDLYTLFLVHPTSYL